MDKKPTRVISDNRINIPEEFRDKHDLEQGDRVWVYVEPIDPDRTISTI